MADKIVHNQDNGQKAPENFQNLEGFRKELRESGIDLNELRGSLDQVLSNVDPLSSTGFEQIYTPESHPYEQPWYSDFMSGVWNSLVIGTGEGLANLIPTLAQASGVTEETGTVGEFFEDWKNDVTEWFDGQRTIYSDSANQPIEEFKDINAGHFWKSTGEGVGFILGIMAGGSGAVAAVSKVPKVAQAFNKIGKLDKMVDIARMAGRTEDVAKLTSQLNKARKAIEPTTKWANRVGNFITGTTLMYPMLDKEAREAGLSDADAARFALGVSGLVSATEGIALEWIGKAASRPLKNQLVSKPAKEALKGLRKGEKPDPLALQKVFLEKHAAARGKLANVLEGAAVETGQEFSQTYIEEGAKQLYDTIWSEERGGEFGADVTDYQTFVEATFGGLIGGLLGGGMTGVQSLTAPKGSGDLGTETMYAYINNAVQQKKPENIQKIKDVVGKMLERGDISEKDAMTINERVDSFVTFAENMNTTDVKDGLANYQLYQLDDIDNDIISSVNKIAESVTEDAPKDVKTFNEEKIKKLNTVQNTLHKNFSDIFNSKKPETTDKPKFENKLADYRSIVDDIVNKNISQDEVQSRLNELVAETQEEEATKDAQFGTEYKTDTGVKLTQKALENRDAITKAFADIRKAQNDDNTDLANQLLQEVQDEYGIDKEAINYMIQNPNIDIETLEEIEPTTKAKKKAEPGAKISIDEQLDLADQEIQDIDEAAANREIDETEAEILKGIRNARIDGDTALENDLIDEFFEYNERQRDKEVKAKKLREAEKDRTFELYKDYYDGKSKEDIEAEYERLMTGEAAETDPKLRVKKLEFLRDKLDVIEQDERIKKRQQYFDKTELEYVNRLLSDEIGSAIREFYGDVNALPTSYLKMLSDELYDIYNKIKADKLNLTSTERKDMMSEVEKDITAIENEINQRLEKDEQEELKPRGQEAQEEYEAKVKEFEDSIETDRTGQPTQRKRVKKPTKKQTWQEKYPNGVKIGNYIVDVIGDIFNRVRVVSARTGQLASRRKADEVLSEFSLDENNLDNMLSGLSDAQINEALDIIDRFFEQKTLQATEDNIQETLEAEIFQALRNMVSRGQKLERVGEVQDAPSNFVVGKTSKKLGYSFDALREDIQQMEQFANLDSQDVIEAIYDFVNQYEGIQDYLDATYQGTATSTMVNLSEDFKDITELPLTNENVNVVYNKLQSMLDEREGRLREEVAEEEAVEKAQAETEPQTEMDFEQEVKEEVEEEVEEEPLTEEFEEVMETADEAVDEAYAEELRGLDPDQLVTRYEQAKTQQERDAIVNEQVTRQINSFGKIKPRRDQRANTVKGNDSLIRNNPKLYENIKKHFKAIFPNLTVKEVDNLGQKYGAQVLARVSELGIQIDPKRGFQSSLIHEYAHVYLDILGYNHPLVKVALEQIEGTQFDLDAQKKYPIGEETLINGQLVKSTRQDQLIEALTEAIAQDSLEKLTVKFEGSKLAKFQEFLKRFWRKIKSYFTKPKSRDIVAIISDGLIAKNTPFSVDNSSLTGIEMDQRSDIDSRFSTTIDIVNAALINQRLSMIANKEFSRRFRNKDGINMAAFSSLIHRYYQEKSGLVPDSQTKIFEGIDLGFEDAFNLTEEAYDNMTFTFPKIKQFAEKLNSADPELVSYADRVVESMFNTNLEPEEFEDFDSEQDQDIDDDPKSDSAVKKQKKVNVSVRAIISSMVDENGYNMNTDNVWKYIGLISGKTYNKASLMKRINDDANKGDIIAQRLQSLTNTLSPDVVTGLQNVLASIMQQPYEGMNYTEAEVEEMYNEEGEYEGVRTKSKTSITNRIVNADKTNGGKYDLVTEKLKKSQDDKLLVNLWNKTFSGKYKQNLEKFLDGDIDLKRKMASLLSNTIGYQVDPQTIDKLANVYASPESFFSLFASPNYNSLSGVVNGRTDVDELKSFINKMIQFFEDGESLQHNFLNAANNSVTTTQNGHWISEQSRLLTNPETGRMKKMLESNYYKNNPVLSYINDKGFVKNTKHDAVKNLSAGKIVEYGAMSNSDYLQLQLSKFGSINSDAYYMQTVGVKSNRDSITFFEVPKYSNTELAKHYTAQAEMLNGIMKELIAKNPERKAKIIKDFRDMYIHNIDENGNVTSGYMSENHKAKIDQLVRFIESQGLTDLYLDTANNRNKYNNNIREFAENFYYTEALNRTSLNDIFSGIPLWYAASEKPGAKQNVKRMSGIDSTGLIDELDKPVYTIVIDSKSLGSDSFNFNSRHLTQALKDNRGPLDPVMINSKDQVYQVDPKTGKTLYLKKSSMNIEGDRDNNNLSSFGGGYDNVAKLLYDIEDYIEQTTGEKPYIKLMDSKAIKGSYEIEQSFDFYELVNQVSEGRDMDKLIASIPKMNMVNHRTIMQAHKKLGLPYEQEALMGTQGALIQLLNKPVETRNEYEEAVVKVLQQNMKGVVERLQSSENLLDALSDDLADREKSATSELINVIKEYNKNNPANPIEALDHPTMRAIVEQLVSSKLETKGIKLNLPGNFLHQLPDIDPQGKISKALAKDEIAVSWKMFFNESPFIEGTNQIKPEMQEEIDAFYSGDNSRVVVERIPTSAEMSVFGGKVAKLLNTEANVVILSDGFVQMSDSDHDGDKAMVYRRQINKEGVISPYTNKSVLFDQFYDNVTTPEFIAEQNKASLKFEEIIPERLKAAGIKIEEEKFSTADIVDTIDVAGKMKFGTMATGRFAIASKLMALLTNANVSLNSPITFNKADGTKVTLKDFNNSSSQDVALLLQAALDMGNDPILSSTGFNTFTIDVGNAMLLLGLDMQETFAFLNNPEIQSIAKQFERANSVFNSNKVMSLEEFLKPYKTYEGPTGATIKYTRDEIIRNYTDENGNVSPMADFLIMSDVANDLSKMIDYIQLDKSLPNSSNDNFNLTKNIQEFNTFSFNADALRGNTLYKWRERMLNGQRVVNKEHLLTAQPELQLKLDAALDFKNKKYINVNNPFEFKNKFNEDVVHMISQNQLSKRRDDVPQFMADTTSKLRTIYNASVLGNTEVKVNKQIKQVSELEGQPQVQAIENLAKATNDTVENVKAMLDEYQDSLADIVEAGKYADNSVFKHLQFYEDADGNVLVSLSPSFKATAQTQAKFKEDFEKLMEIDPELANDIIDYQLYRYGVNNKIGSFIEGLPDSISIKLMQDLTRYKNNPQWIEANFDNLYNNVLLKNANMISDFNEKLIDKTTKSYEAQGFVTSPNYTAFAMGGMNVANQNEIDNLKNNC